MMTIVNPESNMLYFSYISIKTKTKIFTILALHIHLIVNKESVSHFINIMSRLAPSNRNSVQAMCITSTFLH